MKLKQNQAIAEWANVTCMYTCGIFRNDAKHWPSTVSVFGDTLCVAVKACRDIFSPITQVHTCGSFTFMVIQIMKLSIQEILRWEQWTQLPPAACEMGWYSPRQMGEAAVGQQSNHIHFARFSVFPVRGFCSNLSTGGGHGTWDHYIVGQQFYKHSYAQSLRSTSLLKCSPQPLTHLRFLSSLTSDLKSSDTHTESGRGITCTYTDVRISKPSWLFLMIYSGQSRFTFKA